MKTKFFSMYGKAKSADGTEHYVTVVGKLTQEKVRLEKEIDTLIDLDDYVTEGTATYSVKAVERKLKIGYSICHPHDTFDEEIGIKVAKKRIKNGDYVGELETHNITMLNDDQCNLNVFGELNYIIKNIDKYINVE